MPSMRFAYSRCLFFISLIAIRQIVKNLSPRAYESSMEAFPELLGMLGVGDGGKPELDNWRLPRPLPPMSDLFEDENSTSLSPLVARKFANYRRKGRKSPKLPKENITSLLDFVVAGIAKSGTTTMGATLAPLNHKVGASAWDNCIRKEMSEIIFKAYNEWDWANMTDASPDRPLRGFKCPQLLEMKPDFFDIFPQVKVIVGLRNPVRWFESFYNFIVQTNGRIPSPYEKAKVCDDCNKTSTGCADDNLFCVNRARFYVHLAKMKKTPMGIEEKKYLSDDIAWIRNHYDRSKGISNPVFLYETTQFSQEVDSSQRELFWKDVGEFVGYNGPMPEQQNFVPGSTPNKRPDKQIWLDSMKIDICNPIWDKLRSILMDHAYQSSQWIRKYLLELGNDIYVSNKTQFTELIARWESDPCQRLTRMRDGSWAVNGTAPDAVVERVEISTDSKYEQRWKVINGTTIPMHDGENPMHVGCGMKLEGRKTVGQEGNWSCLGWEIEEEVIHV